MLCALDPTWVRCSNGERRTDGFHMSTQHPSCLARARCDDGRVFRFALRFPHLFTARLDPLAAHAGSNGPILASYRLKRARSAASRRAIPGTRDGPLTLAISLNSAACPTHKAAAALYCCDRRRTLITRCPWRRNTRTRERENTRTAGQRACRNNARVTLPPPRPERDD